MTTAVAAAIASPLAADTLTTRLLEAFCSDSGPEVFHSIVQPTQIWSADPFDVETIHEPAREMFERLLFRANRSDDHPTGRLLLLKGESGSGKTHLMRAFRTFTHAEERGYFGYLQMTTQVSNYARYVLGKLIDALDQPYRLPDVQLSGLMRLAHGLLESLPDMATQELERFREGDVPDLIKAVETHADRLVLDPRFSTCDLDLLRALLFLQRNDPRVRLRTLKWLRCEGLSTNDQALLGGLIPRTDEEDPLRMISQLGRLMGTIHLMPLVLTVDQLEEMEDQDAGPDQFRKFINTVVAIADEVPSSVVVIACLDEHYIRFREHLTRPKLDRIEKSPEPIVLTSLRSLEEVVALVARRLRYYYETMNLPWKEEFGTFPFTQLHLAPLAGLRTRDIIHFCRTHRERCMLAGRWIEPEGGEKPLTVLAPSPSTAFTLDQLWNDFQVTFKAEIPDEEPAMAEILGWAIKQCKEELPAGHGLDADANGRIISVEASNSEGALGHMLVAICDKAAQGGGLGRQIAELQKQAQQHPAPIAPVVVRSTEFPANPKTAVSKQIAQVLKEGGRRVVVENADWRNMAAFRAFHRGHAGKPKFSDWLREGRPLTQLTSLQKILDLDQWLNGKTPHSTVAKVPAPTSNQPASPRPQPFNKPIPPSDLMLGTRRDIASGPVTLKPKDLIMHAAFLGGSGSGKTTAALTLVEQVLERGIPVVLLDRKGDLCRYADPAGWNDPLADPHQVARRQRLRECIDVAIYTPGEPNGRPLTIPLMPEGADRLPPLELEQLAGSAAAALGSMMNFKGRGTDQSMAAILRKAIEILAGVPGVKVTVDVLQKFIEAREDTLVAAVGGFNDRLYAKLSEALLTLWLHYQRLLSGKAESLDIDILLGRSGPIPPGKTRMSIVSTRFLGEAVDFWVSQLLVALGRWIGKNPSSDLQAIFLFDEADLYLPALKQPATKAPMENLLRRARSAGVGLLLATQSPGDFDYKCRDNIRTWLVGRIKEQTALNKLKPMLSECKVDVAAKLPVQSTGQFYLLQEREVFALQTQPCLLRTDQLPEDVILGLAKKGRPS